MPKGMVYLYSVYWFGDSNRQSSELPRPRPRYSLDCIYNAPADALFGEMRVLDLRGLKLAVAKRNLMIVHYPEPDFELVTIGSRVGCLMMGDEFQMDITGNLPINLKPGEDIETGSIDAPMPRALLGASLHSVIGLIVGSRELQVTIISLNQTAQENYYSAQSTA